MKYVLAPVWFLLLVFGLNSCQKDPTFKTEMEKLWDCSAAQHFDTIKLANQLIGNWQWTKSTVETTTTKANKNILVTFTHEGHFTVSENATILTKGNWRLKPVDVTVLGLSMDTASQFLHGRIILCEDKVVFNNSYLDGADHFFIRKK